VRRVEPAVGLESIIVAHLPPGHRVDLSSLIARFFGRPSWDAVDRVFEAAEDEAASRGLYDWTSLDPICDRIAALEPAFLNTAERWNRFVSNEPDLCHALLHVCFTAIDKYQFRQRVNVGGGD
jgi:hypothetical protein